MQASQRILIGIIAVLIIGAGLLTGILFSDKARHERINTFLAVQDTLAPNFNTYEISPPSRGAMLTTVDAPLTLDIDHGIAVVAKEDAADIKTGQRVLLYDAQGEAMEKFGSVSAVDVQDGVTIKVTVSLNESKTESSNAVARGAIITENISNVPRLPLAAIVQKDGAAHLWEANENADGTHTAYFKPAKITRQTKEFVALEENPASGNIFILNPDSALRDGEKINVKKTLYAGPELTEEGRILLMISNRHREREREVRMTSSVQSNPALGVCTLNKPAPGTFVKQIEKINDDERKEKIRAILLERALEREAKKKAAEAAE